MSAATMIPSELLDTLTNKGDAPTPALGFLRREQRFSPQERLQFTSQLAMMTGAGVALSTALNSIARQAQRPAMKRAVQQINEDVLSGTSFSGALKKHPGLCDGAYAATISAGEASGKMNEVLSELAELQHAELRLRRTLRGMLVYPMLLTIVSLVVITTLVVFVLPKFASIFEQYELSLPLVTQLLMGVADEIRCRWWLWAPLGGAGIGCLVAARVTPTGRRMIDTALIRAPGFSRLTRLLIGARACRLLALLIDAGVPLLDCLVLLRGAISNHVFKDLTNELEDAVINGRNLSDALEKNEALPPSAPELIATAEKTGRLGEVARIMGSHYDEEGQSAARQLISVVEPLVTILMGAIVAVVVLAVMLPVFDIATIAQR